MARYADEGVIPLNREQLWQFLELHTQEAAIRRIHPDILSQRTVSSSREGSVFDRGIKFFGKVRHSNWKLTYERPDVSRWEILESEGPMLTGSYLVNRYSDA